MDTGTRPTVPAVYPTTDNEVSVASLKTKGCKRKRQM